MASAIGVKPSSAPSGAGERPRSHVRWLVVAMLFVFSALTIIDRVAISGAKSVMATEIGIPDVQFGLIFGVFALGYAAFQIPAGWAADRYGPRVFLAAIVLAWSFFTGVTGLVTTVPALLVVRFLFGAAEAGIYPTASRALYSWMPRHDARRNRLRPRRSVGGVVPRHTRSQADRLGTTLITYITHVRLAHACELLRETDLPVGEIAARVGLPDHTYFDRRFRQHFRTSPRAMRAQWSPRKSA